MTYEQLQMNGLPSSESERQQSYRQDSPVNLTALQEKVSAIVTIVTSRARLQECSEKFTRAGSSVRIRQVYSQEAISGTSVECSTTLPRWGIRLAGEYGELVTSEPRTKGKECSSSQIKFPTPLSSDSIRMRYIEESLRKVGMRRTNGEYVLAGCNLSEYVAVHPGKSTGWKLNPTWVDWLMGFPIGWTDLDASGTP